MWSDPSLTKTEKVFSFSFVSQLYLFRKRSSSSALLLVWQHVTGSDAPTAKEPYAPERLLRVETKDVL